MIPEPMVIGLNHSTAPVEIREKITFPGNERGEVCRAFLALDGVHESLIVSTCNRAEVLVGTTDASTAADAIIKAVGDIHSLDTSVFRDHLYVRTGSDAVRHVYRVASSLDSMVLGEPQIVGQVKEAYRQATAGGTTGPMLNRLMHKAFFTAKRVRNETGVGLAAVSVAYVAVELASKILGDLAEKSVLLVGAGEMAELAARHLLNQIVRPIAVVNRTFQSAVTLAAELGGSAMEMDRLEEALENADVVITSTGSSEPLIGPVLMREVMKRRRYRPVFLIDIAIPRDVAPEVHQVDGVYLYNIDDLQAVADENLGERRQEAERGETIVADEVMKFMEWTRTLGLEPTIKALIKKLEQIREGELGRMNGKLTDLTPEQRDLVEGITRSIIKKIAHDPIVFLKRTKSRAGSNIYLDAAQRMFSLEDFLPRDGSDKKESSKQ